MLLAVQAAVMEVWHRMLVGPEISNQMLDKWLWKVLMNPTEFHDLDKVEGQTLNLISGTDVLLISAFKHTLCYLHTLRLQRYQHVAGLIVKTCRLQWRLFICPWKTLHKLWLWSNNMNPTILHLLQSHRSRSPWQCFGPQTADPLWPLMSLLQPVKSFPSLSHIL